MSVESKAPDVPPPMHPGEVLREEFLVPLGLSPGMVARACGVPRTRIERVVSEQIGVTTDTALRLARFFGTSAAFWLNLQRDYEIETLQRSIGVEIERITPLSREAA